MPIFDIDPGTSPEAPGTLRFYEQGQDEDSGVVMRTSGDFQVPANFTTGGSLTIGGDLTTTSNIKIVGGGGLMVAEGENSTMGKVTLTAGAATVATDEVTADSRIFLTSQSDGGTPGFVRISARTAGTSFTITSSSGTDTSAIAWFLVEPTIV